MLKLDRYLLSEFAQSTFAALVVLLIVSVGGVITDVLKDIASGRLPAGLMLSQLGLVLLNWLPLILPLALMLGMMLGVGRLYRDSEMPVIAASGVGPTRLLKPVLMLVVPVVLVVGACSLWLGPMAEGISRKMINEANRNLVVSGLEPGSFTELPGGGVVYVGAMSADGSQFRRVFIYRRSDDRLDVTTANAGALSVDAEGERYLELADGFQVEGPADDGLDYRLMRYATNEVRLPAGEERYDPNDPEMMPTTRLLGDPRPEAKAQLHFRLAPPFLTLAFGLMAVPLARSTPRQARYGRVMMGFLAYLVGIQMALMGRDWLETGRIAPALGLWWLVLPLLVFALWLYFTDGRMRQPLRVRRPATAGAAR
ncbi:LPS export ABC transporter permease LptF [Novilysobacter luteus]|uniref:Lipopolysaccharide export system permease protein LptF n=1 Tax=Novilysobacter luteus TaxID=2822368 RepID=A0ABN7QYE7_9GAMM|nr:LPS export ABC transporter permease LptF [Lysobacter luteus]CAG4976825.1 Lipopolysaccharide export system permease protein LptF [Lysobacter luteus]